MVWLPCVFLRALRAVMFSLEVIQGPDKGQVFSLRQQGVIGRQSDTVPLSDGTVSRHHARVLQRDSTWMIEDVGSVNGTFLNSVRLKRPSRLHLGDQIRCGRTLLVFAGPAKQARPPMEENGRFLDASIMATVPANEDSIIIPTPEAGAEAIDNLRVLYNLTAEISSIFNADTLVARTLDLVFDVLHADRAFILLLSPDGKLIPKAGRSRREQDEEEMPISRTMINEVIAKQVGVLSSNAMRDERFSRGKSVHAFGIRSALCVPIKGHERALGVIHVDSSVSDCTYSTEQLRLLTAIGYQTGLALENVRLLEEKVRSERLAAVGETAALLSHHIKNILQALGGGTDVVEKAINEGSLGKAKASWPVVRRSIDRLNNMILNLLAYSKPRQPQMESIGINHLIQEVVDMCMPQADEAGIALLADLGEVPPIPADASGLHQAVLNLITNAFDAVQPRQGVVTVSTQFDEPRHQVLIRVADNGMGIPPKQIDRIFELFHSSKGQRGTGLGLAVVKKITQEHGGRVEVDSTPGKGTTFTLHLSARPARALSSSDTQGPG